MAEQNPQLLPRRIRILLIGFIIGLTLSGVTAFPLEWELNLLASWLGASQNAIPQNYSGLVFWIVTVRNGLRQTNADFPFLAYGTDWLAFIRIAMNRLALRDYTLINCLNNF